MELKVEVCWWQHHLVLGLLLRPSLQSDSGGLSSGDSAILMPSDIMTRLHLSAFSKVDDYNLSRAGVLPW